MIFLALTYLCFISGPWNSLALPIDSRPPEILPKNHLQSIFIREEDRFDTRSVYSIFWSCLSTIFACTWIAVHPNIPAPGDSWWEILGRRLAIMGYILLAPEFVIFWAARQHYVARDFVKKHGENTGWTRTHAFFLIMGGFTLHDGIKSVRVLEAEDLERLSEAGKIKWPTITKEEIADRSKGDYLSKAIVLFQATWFVGQCIARGAYGLTVTELEVVTVAFAGLTGVIYYLWWDKPLDVRCSIQVHLLGGHLGKIKGDIEKEVTGPQIVPPSKICLEETSERDENVVTNPNPLPIASIHVDISTPDRASTRMQRFQAFRRGACDEYGTLFGRGYVFIGFPLKRFLSAFGDMSFRRTLGDKNLRVPTFYSPYNDDDPDDMIPSTLAMCVATIFGAIHCIAWSFHFVTLQERWVWRIAAILVSGMPISLVAVGFFAIFCGKLNNPTWKKLYKDFLGLVGIVMLFLYIFARIILLVLPFVALRALPPGAYVQINWVGFLPHI